MKQVKKLLVILPLVALFVLGSVPVLATDDPLAKWDETSFKLNVKLVDGVKVTEDSFTLKLSAVLKPTEFTDAVGEAASLSTGANKATAAKVYIQENIKKFLASEKANYEIDNSSLKAVAGKIADAITVTVVAGPPRTYTIGAAAVADTITLTKKAAEPAEPGKKPEDKTEAKSKGRSIDVVYFENMKAEGTGNEFHRIYNLPDDFLKNAGVAEPVTFSLENLDRLTNAIRTFIEAQLQDGYRPIGTTYRDAANTLLNTNEMATVRMGRPGITYSVIAYDIHNNRFVFDRLFELEMEDGWGSESDISKSFYNHSDTLSANYLYAGFATRNIAPVIVFRATYLETIARANYLRALNRYNAQIVTFVVPRIINVTTYHVFPEGTRAELSERVPVPYETWASLQFSSQFMNLPEIFKTRIQKVNEMGFSFREIRYYSGINEITGLLSGYDWNGDLLTSDGDDACCARVFYDKAVAGAQEVPSEKKVDAATAPQAQIKAPAAQAPVVAANTTTTTAPVNTLPVTGASDSIFLFLSSAALMAVGILFFKKH